MNRHLKYLWIILPLLLLCCKDKQAKVIFSVDEAKDATVILESQGSETGGSEENAEVISFEKQQYIFEAGIGEQRQEDIKINLDSNRISPVEIVGWSENGLLAYRERIYSDGMPGFIYKMVIFNPIDDRILEQDSAQELAVFLYQDPDEEWVKKWVIEYRTKWNSLLEKHNIIGRIDNPIKEIAQAVFLQFPVDNFECWFDYTIEATDPGDYWYDCWINWKLIVGNDNVQKIINVDKERNYTDISGRKILGYMRNPYANSIVVFVNHYATYFGPRGGINLYGCNMDVGFTKK